MGNVLIIDDEPAIGTFLAGMISRLGYQTVTAFTASESFEKLEHNDFQLIIADIRLPDAPDAHVWIKALSQKAAGRPVVLMSGAPSAELSAYASSNGVLTFLSKPFELAFIKSILKTIFDKPALSAH